MMIFKTTFTNKHMLCLLTRIYLLVTSKNVKFTNLRSINIIDRRVGMMMVMALPAEAGPAHAVVAVTLL